MNYGAPSVEVEKTIKDEFAEALAQLPDVGIETRAQQLEILEALPEQYMEVIFRDIVSHNEDQIKHDNHPIDSEDELMSFLHGNIFEDLVKIEVYKMLGRTIEEQELAEAALDLFQHPDKYGLDETLRNPDLALIDVKNRLIMGAVEAKSGKLNERAIDQILSFDRSMRKILAIVAKKRERYEPRRFNKSFAEYTGISENIANLRVSKDFSRFFFVPRDRKFDNDSLFVAQDESTGHYYSEEEKEDFANELIGNNVQFRNACFSGKEVGAFARIVRARLKQEYDY